ncbi:MAG TPA: hypothetical protein VJ697_01465 [Nitrososphaeraceae archaeon]|nr:hypothetical protein [Nitrososphaeraceae archaeon]
MNKSGNVNRSNKRNNNAIDEQAIKNSIKWSITEYSIFVTKIIKKGLSLFSEENLGKNWFSGIYINDQGKLNFTNPFTIENRPIINNIIGAVGSFNLNDSKEYFVISETNNKFVEVLDNKGEISPDFPLNDYSLRLSQNSSGSKNPVKVSVRKYDDAVSNFIRNEIQQCSFLNLFEIYIEEKINKLNKSIEGEDYNSNILT